MKSLSFTHCGKEAVAISHVTLSYPNTITFYWYCLECKHTIKSRNLLTDLMDLSAGEDITDADRKFLSELHIKEKP